MAQRDIIVIGASAGGVYALKELIAALPADLPATLFIVLHVSPNMPSLLPSILNHVGKLKAVHPSDGEPILPGHIYVAPPDHHLLVENNQVLVKKGPKENRFRPSIDALFRSAAYTYGPRVIGVIMTGLLDDGTSGMWSVKRLGGVSVIQEPEEALYPSMPESVKENVAVDYVVPVSEMGKLFVELTQQTVEPRPALSPQEVERMSTEIKIAEQDNAFTMQILEEGNVVPLTCPECHGALVSIQEGTLIRYRCHTGHGFTAGSLLADVNKNVEAALWNAIRGLDEAQILLQQTARVLQLAGNKGAAQEYGLKADEAQQRAEKIRTLVFE